MKKFLSKYAFWVVQISSWLAVAIFCAAAAGDHEDSRWTIIMMIFSIALAGIITTSLLRRYLKRRVPLEGFDGKSLLKIFISTFLATILYIIIIVVIIGVFSGLEHLIGMEKGAGDGQDSVSKKDGFLLFLAGLFGFLFILFGWVIFYYSIRFIRKSYRQNIKRLELRNSIKEAQIDMLRGQIDPQFMAKSLKRIGALMTVDVNESRLMITKLAEILRFTLVQKNKGNSDIEDELEIVRNYIEIFKLDKTSKFNFSENVSEELKGFAIPAMLILTIVENILKNGVNSENNDVILSIFKEKESLITQIEYNGLPVQKVKYDAAINRIRQRLSLQFDDRAMIESKSNINNSKLVVTLSNFFNSNT